MGMSRTTRSWAALWALAAVAALAFPGAAAAAPSFVTLGDFNAPISVTAPPRDTSRVFVVERGGTIRVARKGVVQPAPFLDIRGQVSLEDERGLLSMAFAPDYEASGLFYVYLTASDPAGELQVREYRRSATDPDRADLTGRVVWRQAHAATNHNGGQVEFGPDGRLWFATGDGAVFDGQLAQDMGSQLGKLLRIDPRPGNAGTYTVPADNPYFGRLDVAQAIWAAGLRNPFRFSFDRVTGDLVLGDVGQAAREEVNWARASDGLGRGLNFGWPCFEGSVAGPRACSVNGYMPPVYDYAQGSPRSITGGYVVRDPGLPTLAGRYVYADFYTGEVRSLVLATPRAGDERSAQLPIRRNLAAFGEDACGHLYVASLNGTVERVQDGLVGACVLKPDPPGGPPPPPLPPPPDTTAPRLDISAASRQRARGVLSIRVSVRCDEPCRVAANASLRGVTQLRQRTVQLPAGHRVVVRLRPTVSGARKIKRSLRRRKSLRVVITVQASDASGNRSRAERRVTLRR
jgi:glucose/arabinose dehydrogenase